MSANLFGERFYGNRTAAWHNLGYVSQEDQQAVEALEIIGGYNIDKRPVVVNLNGSQQEVGDYALVRSITKDDPKEIIFGYCTKQYNILQPAEICKSFDENVKQPIETLGMLGKGEKLFLTWKLPEIDVNDDPVETYGFVASGYDGKFGSSLSIVTTRVVCQNTFNIAISESESKSSRETGRGRVWGGKHNSNNALRDLGIWMEHVQGKALEKVNETKNSFVTMAEYSINNTSTLADILFQVYPDPQMLPKDYPSKLRDEKQNKIDQLIETARKDRNAVDELFSGQGTSITSDAWGLFNSVTEYENWGRMTKKPAEYSIIMGNRSNTMSKAYNVINSYIKSN